MSGVIGLTTNESMNQLISLSNDKNVRVWDIRNMLCIQSLFDSTIYRPENRLGHILYDEKSKSIINTSRKLNVWPLRVQEGSTN
jgi:WD40 repeat protein